MGSYVFVATGNTNRMFVYYDTERPEPGRSDQLYFCRNGIDFCALIPSGYTGDETTHLLVFTAPDDINIEESLVCDVNIITHEETTYTLDDTLEFDPVARKILRSNIEETPINIIKMQEKK